MKVKGCTKSVQEAQTSWMTSCATELLLPKFFQNLFTYAEGSKVRVSLGKLVFKS